MGIALVAAVHLLLQRPYSPICWLRVVATSAGMLTLGTRMGNIGAIVLPLIVGLLHIGRVRRWSHALVVGVFSAVVLVSIAGVAVNQVEELRSEAYLWRRYERLLAFIRVPCQIVRQGRRIVYRLLAWNPWQHVFLRAVDALRHPMRC